ncbi:hypothetical protein QQF64_000459 [Cirrhinus molitorella]|uniref:Ubiquitin-like protease family profile domain-containing protein n=1 Tax=Cirrhinus molitorella TaxID=172907 RepID=A0ABR3NXZ3_9TELE
MQPDATSCGVFVCKFAEALLLRGDLNFSCDDTNIAQMREELVYAFSLNQNLWVTCAWLVEITIPTHQTW